MEAGNRCFDQRVPEEINRKIADHLSDVNIVISDQAKQNLISEGINKEFIFKFGSNMFDVIKFYEKDSFYFKKKGVEKTYNIIKNIDFAPYQKINSKKKFFFILIKFFLTLQSTYNIL